jgi:A-kinase anchor protein 10
LNDKTTLSFFVQYLEHKNELPLVKFFLDCQTVVESSSFSDRTCESRSSNYCNIKLRDKSNFKKSSSSTTTETNAGLSTDGCETLKDFYDSVSISTTTTASNFDEIDEVQSTTTPDVTLDEEIVNSSSSIHQMGNDVFNGIERMTQSLTDDEKSKICEKNRNKNEDSECDTKSANDQESRKFQPMIFEDALRIYRKYLIIDSSYPVELPATILAKLSLALCGSDLESEVDLNNLWRAFEEAQKYVFDVMDKEYLVDFLESSFYCKYTIDVLTNENLCLAEILHSESALFYFMEFLEQDKQNGKQNYLEFCKFFFAATNFRKQQEQLSDEAMHDEDYKNQLRADALVIYEKWFSLQAPSSLNFSNRVRMNVEERICSSSTACCFDIPIKIVEIYLERNCFKPFVKSQLFFKYLSEVMSKIDMNTADKNANTEQSGIIRRNSSFVLKFPTKNKHRRTNSEVNYNDTRSLNSTSSNNNNNSRRSLTKSISTQNTLLAGLDSKRCKNTTDLHIDSQQIANPDLLWHRHSMKTKLSFGRVNPYGKFERDFEMPTTTTSSSANIPTSKSFQLLQEHSIDVDDPNSIFEQAKWSSAQNRIKNAMRKLVHLPEDSLQQEIAWQVAELIVKDVTKITLSENSPST